MENYEYSRKKASKTSEDVSLASNKRRIIYIVAGIAIALLFVWIKANY